MSQLRVSRAGLLLAVVLGCGSPTSLESASRSSTPQTCALRAPDYQTKVQPLVARYCSTCHAPGGDAEEHDFSQPERLRAERRVVGARLRAHSMPPSTSPQPSAAERALLLHWTTCD